MKVNEYTPSARHKSWRLTIEISDDLTKVRYKGDADSKCSGWKRWNCDAVGQYVVIAGERMYLEDFVSINN